MLEWEQAHAVTMPDGTSKLSHLLKAQSRGHDVAALRNRPRMPERLAFVLQAYDDLQGEIGVHGLIPFSAVEGYCRCVGIADVFWLWGRLRGLEKARADGKG